MLDVLSITIPFFAIILCGSLARLRGWFSEESGQTLARFAFFVVLPPFMFIAITSIDVTALFHIGFVLRYELVTIIMFLIAGVFATYVIRLTPQQRGLFCLNTAYPNYGYIGVPMAILAFGQQAAAPISLILVCDTITLLVMTTILSHDATSGHLGRALRATILSMLRNPLLLTVLAGLGFSASGFQLAILPEQFLKMLAGAAAPTALFANKPFFAVAPLLALTPKTEQRDSQHHRPCIHRCSSAFRAKLFPRARSERSDLRGLDYRMDRATGRFSLAFPPGLSGRVRRR